MHRSVRVISQELMKSKLLVVLTSEQKLEIMDHSLNGVANILGVEECSQAWKWEPAEVFKNDLKDSEHMGSKRFAATFTALSLKLSSF